MADASQEPLNGKDEHIAAWRSSGAWKTWLPKPGTTVTFLPSLNLSALILKMGTTGPPSPDGWGIK